MCPGESYAHTEGTTPSSSLIHTKAQYRLAVIPKMYSVVAIILKHKAMGRMAGLRNHSSSTVSSGLELQYFINGGN